MEETPLSSSPLQQPTPKKPKMSSSTTTDDDDDDTTTTTTTKPIRYKRRKVAIFFAYCGVGYQGMQKNPGAKTIEGDLEEALYLSGAVPETDNGYPKRYDFARSARTDKGVSAVGQVVSGRFYVDPPGFVDRLNGNLVDRIRVFGYKRVTAGFNAKKFCDRRRYVYLLPVFALDGSVHRDRESVMASSGSDRELVKCVECSERGRKVVGVMGKRGWSEPKDGMDENVSRDDDAKVVGTEREVKMDVSDGNDAGVDGNGMSVGILVGGSEIENSFNIDEDLVSGFPSDSSGNVETMVEGTKQAVTREAGNVGYLHVYGCDVGNLGSDERSAVVSEGTNKWEMSRRVTDVEKTMKKSEFMYGEKEKERFNRILKRYEGTHNFHNFTTRTKAEDPSARRYIVSFDASTVITVEGIDFVKCEVVGQSFMLHQIRKMIGLAVAIMRNCAPVSIFDSIYEQDVNINVPTAPEVGLHLDECLFTSYNNKWKDSHEELSMNDYAKEAEEFKIKHIYSHIANTEHNEGAVAVWLHSLNHRNYPDLRSSGNGVPIEYKTDEVCNLS
ncbi:hypothetical protein AKJ16_DCAP23726 [Drosera capensis]